MSVPNPAPRPVPNSTGLKAPIVILAVAAGALVALVSSHAQAADGAEGGRGKRAAEVEQRFKAADTNNDGKLSKDEAKAGMPMVYKHFDEIDSAHTGSVTLAQIGAFVRTQHAAKTSAP